MTSSNFVKPVSSAYDYSDLTEAFPEVEPGLKPFGTRILVQIRSPKSRTKGGIELPHDSRETELWNTQVAKVIALGPVAFKNRDTLEPWPEGEWCKEGTFVRVPKYGGDRWFVPLPNSTKREKALFVLFKDTNLVGEVTIDPLEVIAFI